MKRLENTEENRKRQCEKEIELIINELNNSNNFVKNKIYEEAAKAFSIKEE